MAWHWKPAIKQVYVLRFLYLLLRYQKANHQPLAYKMLQHWLAICGLTARCCVVPPENSILVSSIMICKKHWLHPTYFSYWPSPLDLRPCTHQCRLQSMQFCCWSKTPLSIRVHTNVLMRFRLSTLKLFWKRKNCTLWLEVELQVSACYKHTLLRFFRSPFSFWCVFDHYWPSAPIRYVCVFVLIHFQEPFQIDAFSAKTLRVLVWTEGLKVSMEGTSLFFSTK